MNRYDDRARLVFHFAREEGSKLGHAMIGPEHLLLGLMREGGNASRVLEDFGATLKGLRSQVEKMVGRGDGLPRNETAAITSRSRRVKEYAGEEARSLGSAVIGTEHILLGIIRGGDGVAYRILRQLTRDVDTIRWRILAAADPIAQNETVGASDDSRLLVNSPYPTDDSPRVELIVGLRLVGRGFRHLRSSLRRLADRKR